MHIIFKDLFKDYFVNFYNIKTPYISRKTHIFNQYNCVFLLKIRIYKIFTI